MLWLHDNAAVPAILETSKLLGTVKLRPKLPVAVVKVGKTS